MSVLEWLRELLKPTPGPLTDGALTNELYDGPNDALFKALAAHWTATDSAYVRSSLTGDQIGTLESRYRVRLPDEFRSYLLHAAPASTFMDDVATQWWSLEDIKPVSVECPDGSPGRATPAIEEERDTYLVFSDYLIWCYAWAICCSEGPNRGRVALIGGVPDAFVAPSFPEFVRLALVDAASIHLGPHRSASAA